MSDWADVGRVLLGSWPSQVAGWGREAIAAYVAELAARGITPDAAICAIRMSESPFPPSAGDLQQAARRDHSAPTCEEMLVLVRRAAKRDGRDDEALAHPLVASFVTRYGWDRLRLLPIDDPERGGLHRRDLQGAWDRHVEAFDGRELAALASGRPDGLRQLDPLHALGVNPKALPA